MNRENIHSGQRVLIVLKADQKSGKLTEGIVKDILTRASFHPHGIKVRLEDGQWQSKADQELIIIGF
jgi:uncharacterized repeat protein (TIGR03833 family)